MAKERKFEYRFEGSSNKRLRARIRKVTNEAGSCPRAAEAVRNLAEVEVFTAQGLHTLELVARDYDPNGWHDPKGWFK